jgi:hypothetical protein
LQRLEDDRNHMEILEWRLIFFWGGASCKSLFYGEVSSLNLRQNVLS